MIVEIYTCCKDVFKSDIYCARDVDFGLYFLDAVNM